MSHLSDPIAFFSVIICPTSEQSGTGNFFQACAALLACSFEHEFMTQHKLFLDTEDSTVWNIRAS